MNGVRRFLGGGGGGGGGGQQTPSPSPTPPPPIQPVSPLLINNKQSSGWPPESVVSATTTTTIPYESPKTTTQALFLRNKQKPPTTPPADDEPRRFQSNAMSPTRPNPFQSPIRKSTATSSPAAGPSSPRAVPALPTPNTTPSSTTEWKRTSRMFSTRDELLMSLLSSEAVIDSRDCQILSSEEIDNLKKEQQLLSSRLGAASKKLNLEIKIRDAAISLAKVNASHKRVSKQTDEQLDAANRRVDAAQREVYRISERANEVQRKLLEHRAGVLGYSVRSLEKKLDGVHDMGTSVPSSNGTAKDVFDGSGYSTPNRNSQMSPTPSSMASASTGSKARFDGAHLFAGHADAVIPGMLRSVPVPANFTALEEKLKTATEALAASTRKQGDLARELSHVKLDKQQVETTMAMDLQSAEETIMQLENELTRLEGMTKELEGLQMEKQRWDRERDTLEGRLEVLEEESGDKGHTEKLLADERERSRAEIQRRDEEIQGLKVRWQAEREGWAREREALEDARAEVLVELESAHSSADAVAQARPLQEELAAGVEALRSVAAAHGIPVMSGELHLSGLVDSIGIHLDEVASNLATPGGGQVDLSDVSKVAAVLRPIWSMLPSPEARAAKLGARRAGTMSPTGSLSSSRNGSVGSTGTPQSLSDMDVRSLKTMYDSRSAATPASPNTALFSIDAFAARVQALIADDRSLIERLIRFAQAHDLLKKNAERAQKLAQDGSGALETYQKQMRVLEDRNAGMTGRMAQLQDEIHQLQDEIDRLEHDKHEIEVHADEQAQLFRQLSEDNDKLSARTLDLTEELISAPEKVRQELTAQLTKCQADLVEASEVLVAMRKSEQTQMEALLDELNSMQTENGNLRAQLRELKK